MNNPKIVIISCFDTYETRVDMLYKYFNKNNYITYVIMSEYSHFNKKIRQKKNISYQYIQSVPYVKNISIKRLISHYLFAKNAISMVEKIQPDVLYVLFPPNSLAYVSGKYKEAHPNTKLILDVIDLWPETFPVKYIKRYFPFSLWKNIRNTSLKIADIVFSECELYKKTLKDTCNTNKWHVLYMARSNSRIEMKPKLNNRHVDLCYLGSINNIIDMNIIGKLIKEITLYKPVFLHIIGDGENRSDLIKIAEISGANVIFYGKIFDDTFKHEVFNRCHFGLNIMKESVCVGLTMKSIDYLEAGLPILNTIGSDTHDFVENMKIGFNISITNISSNVEKLCSMETTNMLAMRSAARKLYEEKFSESAFTNIIDRSIGGHIYGTCDK